MKRYVAHEAKLKELEERMKDFVRKHLGAPPHEPRKREAECSQGEDTVAEQSAIPTPGLVTPATGSDDPVGSTWARVRSDAVMKNTMAILLNHC